LRAAEGRVFDLAASAAAVPPNTGNLMKNHSIVARDLTDAYGDLPALCVIACEVT